VKDFNKIKRGFEAYYTLCNQGNAVLAQAAELLKKLEEEYNTGTEVTTFISNKKKGHWNKYPNGPYAKIINIMKTNPKQRWGAAELSKHIDLPKTRIVKILQRTLKNNITLRPEPGKYCVRGA
jgi:hypothetical protein